MKFNFPIKLLRFNELNYIMMSALYQDCWYGQGLMAIKQPLEN